MISDLRYSQIIYKHFKNSPHSRLYDFVFDLDFENFTDFDHRIVDPEFIIEGDWTDVERYKIKQLQ